MAQFNIKLKLIEPGAIKTEFYGRSQAFRKPNYTQDYDAFVAKCEKVNRQAGAKGADPIEVARTIFKASNDTSSKLGYTIASPAALLLTLKRLLPARLFFCVSRASYKI